jgi:hypothetical protein
MPPIEVKVAVDCWVAELFWNNKTNAPHHQIKFQIGETLNPSSDVERSASMSIIGA